MERAATILTRNYKRKMWLLKFIKLEPAMDGPGVNMGRGTSSITSRDNFQAKGNSPSTSLELKILYLSIEQKRRDSESCSSKFFY